MFIITVSERLCKGCGLCVSACPKKLMQISDIPTAADSILHPARMRCSA